jgi:hypothetical protein
VAQAVQEAAAVQEAVFQEAGDHQAEEELQEAGSRILIS